MKLVFSIVLGLFLTSSGFSQDYSKSPFSYPDELPDWYMDRLHKEYEYALDSMYYGSDLFVNTPENEDWVFYAKMASLKRAALYSGLYKKKLLETHKLYYDWTEAENYIKEVLKTIQPERYDDLDSVRIFILRSSEWNAYALDVNEIYITTGLLADIEDEITLAYILGHELGHIEYSDMENLTMYRTEQAAEINDGQLLSFLSKRKARRKLERKSQMSEIKADSFSIQILKNLNFDITSPAGAMQTMENNQKLFHAKLKKKEVKSLFKSHPTSDERLKQLTDFQNGYKGKKKTVVSTSLFRSISNQAKYEKLINWREKGNFYNLVEDAFIYHLQDPTDENYIYFSLEGLRLLRGLNADLADEDFLMNLYEKHPAGVKDGVLQDVLPLYGLEVANLGTHPLMYKGGLTIKTYEDAQNYFQTQALKFDLTESLLTLGLIHIDKDAELAQEYLSKYISREDAVNKAAASYFLGDSVIESYGKLYVVYDNREYYYGRIVWELLNNRDRYFQLYSYTWHTHMEKHVDEDQAIFLDDYKYEKLRDYVLLRQYLSNSFWLKKTMFDERKKKSHKLSKEHYSALWFWPENYSMLNKYRMKDVVLLDEKRFIVTSPNYFRMYDNYLVYDMVGSAGGNGVKERSYFFTKDKKFSKYKKLIQSHSMYKRLYKVSMKEWKIK